MKLKKFVMCRKTEDVRYGILKTLFERSIEFETLIKYIVTLIMLVSKQLQSIENCK